MLNLIQFQDSILNYLLKTGMWIGIFWLVYWLFLRRETFYRFNRHYLLTGLLLSFVIPLMQLKYTVEIVAPVSFDMPVSSVEEQSVHVPFDGTFVLLVIYGCGIVAISIRYLLGLRKIISLLASSPAREMGAFRVIDSPNFRHPFSFFNSIIFNSMEADELAQTMILEHEQTHIQQKHWMDLTIGNLACIFQWFNPFAWLYVKAMKQNHEYLADRSVLQNGHSPAIYRTVLLSCTLNVHASALIHSFAHFGKTNRFLMMKKTASNPLRKSAVFLIFPAFAVFLWAFAQPMYTFNTQNTVQETATIVADRVTPDETTVNPSLIEPEKSKLQIVRQPPKQEQINIESADMTETDDVRVVGFGKFEAISPKIIYRPQAYKGIILPTQTKEQAKVSISSHTRLEANPPLFVLDGVEIPSLNNINPNEIQRIEVLKGVTAISLYGEKGKNGVILINTKEKLKGELMKYP